MSSNGSVSNQSVREKPSKLNKTVHPCLLVVSSALLPAVDRWNSVTPLAVIAHARKTTGHGKTLHRVIRKYSHLRS